MVISQTSCIFVIKPIFPKNGNFLKQGYPPIIQFLFLIFHCKQPSSDKGVPPWLWTPPTWVIPFDLGDRVKLILPNCSFFIRSAKKNNCQLVPSHHFMQRFPVGSLFGGFSMFHKPAASRSDLVISNKHVGMGQNLFIRYDLGHKHPKIPADWLRVPSG